MASSADIRERLPRGLEPAETRPVQHETGEQAEAPYAEVRNLAVEQHGAHALDGRRHGVEIDPEPEGFRHAAQRIEDRAEEQEGIDQDVQDEPDVAHEDAD